jgi:hypothetical protein
MEMPFMIISAQKKKRRRCANAINEKITIAMTVKGFMLALCYP